jgi:hypothetical protein
MLSDPAVKLFLLFAGHKEVLTWGSSPMQVERDDAQRIAYRSTWQPILEEILRRWGILHPVVRKPLVEEAKRLWRALEIAEPIPAIEECRVRALAMRERARRRRGRKRQGTPLTVRLLRK